MMYVIVLLYRVAFLNNKINTFKDRRCTREEPGLRNHNLGMKLLFFATNLFCLR